jgi:hypothetical protein
MVDVVCSRHRLSGAAWQTVDLSKLNKGRDILRLNRWGEAKEVLERVTWVESAGELHGKTLWEELGSFY